ncbi:MAG: NUDIX hydrolase [Rhodoglobus sp.]
MDIRVGAYGVIVRDQSILLTHWREGKKWSLPGGGVQAGEQPIEAAVREIREETGFTAALGRLLTVDSVVIAAEERRGAPDQALHSFRIVYEATILSGGLRQELDGSSDDARWFPLSEVQSLPRVSVVDHGISAAGVIFA